MMIPVARNLKQPLAASETLKRTLTRTPDCRQHYPFVFFFEKLMVIAMMALLSVDQMVSDTLYF